MLRLEYPVKACAPCMQILPHYVWFTFLEVPDVSHDRWAYAIDFNAYSTDMFATAKPIACGVGLSLVSADKAELRRDVICAVTAVAPALLTMMTVTIEGGREEK